MISWLHELWVTLPNQILVAQIAWALFFIAFAMVTLRGGATERLYFASLVIAAYLSHLLWAPPNTRAVYLGLVAIDVGALVALLVIAMSSDRYWPMWLTIALTLALVAELVFLLIGKMSPYVYWNLSAASFEVSCLSVIIGIMVEPPKRAWGWVIDLLHRPAVRRGGLAG